MKKKFFFLLIASFALILHTNAQVMEWYTYWGSNVAGNQIQPIRTVVDDAGAIYTAARFGGNSVQILGQTVSSQSGVDLGDAIIVKMTPDKVAVWSRKLVNSGEAAISDMVIDNEGNLVVTGTFKGTLQADENHSMTMEDPSGYVALSIFVIRYDANGNMLKMWQLPAEEATVESVTVDGSGNCHIFNQLDICLILKIAPYCTSQKKKGGYEDEFFGGQVPEGKNQESHQGVII